MKNRIMGELKKVFRPEFLNRIDEVVVFHKLTKDEIKTIVELLLRRIRESLAERELQLELTEDAKDLLVEKGWDPSMGARPLRRAIQRYIEDPLADFVLRAELHAGRDRHGRPRARGRGPRGDADGGRAQEGPRRRRRRADAARAARRRRASADGARRSRQPPPPPAADAEGSSTLLEGRREAALARRVGSRANGPRAPEEDPGLRRPRRRGAGHIAALAAEVSVPAGKELVREGDYSYDVLAIEEGTARVERDGEHVAELGPGDVFGEMGVLRARAAQRDGRRHLADAAGDADQLGHPPAAEDRAQGASTHLREVVAQRRDQA